MADIKHSIPISASAEQIYPLVATAKGFSQWWATDAVESTGVVELGFFNRTTVYRLRLKEEQPPTQVEWVCETGKEWNGTHITFCLETKKAETVLHFTHANWPKASDYFVSCNTTWGELMFRLKAVAEGKKLAPLFSPEQMNY